MPPEGEQQQQAGQQIGQQQQAPPWHADVEPELLGHWQNRGYKLDTPKDVAIAAGKQARELEKHFGVPADQIVRLPKADARPEDIKAFRMKLGMPAEPKDYDFSGIKGADGEPIAAPLADTLRATAHSAGLSKESAAVMAAAMQKHIDDVRIADATTTNAKLAAEKATLKANWGKDFDFNHLKAMEGARRLGISPEAVKALENQVGYAGVMDAMRKIGQMTAEDTFIERGTTGDGIPHTREGAVARKAELMKDVPWRTRYLAGGVAENREMTALNTMIDGE